jgi:hypothetical protein
MCNTLFYYNERLQGRQYPGEISVRDTLSRDAIYRPVKQYKETGNVCDKRTKGRKQAHLFVGKKSV